MLIYLTGSGYLVGHRLTQATFFHWLGMSGRLFCSQEVKNSAFLSILAVFSSQGNLIWALVDSAKKHVLVVAEVPSDGAGLQGTSEICSFCFSFCIAQYSFYSKTLVLKNTFYGLGKYINELQLLLYSSKLVFFVTSSSVAATMY